MTQINLDSLATLFWAVAPTALITGACIGIGLSVVLWFAFKRGVAEFKKISNEFREDIKRDMPKWILELRGELTKITNVEKAMRDRNYSIYHEPKK